MNILLFSIGAAIGGPLRFWIDILGSFLIGLFVTDANYLVLGFCGALTTWSTFIFDVYSGIANKQLKHSLINLIGSLILGVLAFKFGISVGSA
jgi:CrcB protein